MIEIRRLLTIISTVSKVLRQKEKYLLQDEGSRSPVKRAKGRSPDIERALAVWAKNHVRFIVRTLISKLRLDSRNEKGYH